MGRPTVTLVITPTPELVQALHEVMPTGAGEVPTRITGTVWGNGTWRRICAVYPNGCKLTVNFGKRGHVTSAKSSFEMVVKGPAK